MESRERQVKKNKHSKNSIFVKIIAVSMVCMAIPLIVTNVCAINLMKQTMGSSAQENLITLAQNKEQAIDHFIDSQLGICYSIATNPEIIEICNTCEDPLNVEASDRDKMSQYLMGICENQNNVYENIFFTVGSQCYANTIGNTAETLTDVSGEEFFETCKTEGSFVGSNISPGSGQPVYVISYAITDPDTNKFLGVVNASISCYSMAEDFVFDTSNENLDVYLVDFNGNIVACKNEDKIMSFNIKESDTTTWETMMNEPSGFTTFSDGATGVETVTGYYTGTYYVCQVAEVTTVYLASVNKVSNQTLMIFIIAIILASFLIAICARTIVKPLIMSMRTVNNLVEDIHNGHADLNTMVAVTTKDEVGQLGTSINQFIETLKDVMSMLKTETVKLTEVTENVAKNIEDSQNDVSNISAAMEEMSASGEETSASLQQVSSNLEQVTSLVNYVYNESIKHAKESEQVLADVKVLTDGAIAESDRSDERARELVKELEESIELAKKVESINSLVDDILGITSQTNLLSLNASIEAARAGEAGKGFAVVADEISKLANDSADTASHIQNVSKEVITAVNELASRAAKMSETLMETNENNRNNTSNMADSFEEAMSTMVKSMEGFADNSSKANNAMEEIKEAVEGINIAVEEMAQGVANSTQSISDIASNLANINEDAFSNRDISQEIYNNVSKYQI